MSPVANDNVPLEHAGAMEPFFPLCALVCAECFLVQLAPYETPKPIFRDDYAYFSSYSTSWLEHSRRYTEQMIERLALDGSSQVIELASNDGYLLQYFQQAGVPVLGVEPTANTAQVAIDKGIPTRVDFWGVETAGHLLKLIELNQWDTIYHEHYSYLSFGTVGRVFAAHGLRLFDVQELPTHGGSLRIFACHDDTPFEQTDAARELHEREDAAGLNDVQTYRDYGARVVADKRQILRFLIELKEAGNSIAGYGAPAKGNTLLNYCGVGREFVDFTCDANPHKQRHVLPGTHIPVLAPEAIRERRPDVVLILPWNIKDEIMDQLSDIREWGGRFAARAPELRLFP